MNLQKYVPLAHLTTLGVGGRANVFIEARTDREVEEAIAYANEHHLPLYPLGAGSNVLVPDTGVKGVVLKMMLDDHAFEHEGDATLLIAGAGTPWEKIVAVASDQNLFGIENLVGIPGTIGGATVQNIGAYGAELADVFNYADVIDSATGIRGRVSRTEAAFGYRTSLFKGHRELVIIRVALRLLKQMTPNITYPDLVRAQKAGVPLRTPSEIARAVRAIRAKKFPYAAGDGSAGSFFQNPIIPRELADSLAERFPGLPLFPQGKGHSKMALAWFLDHVLSLKGFSKGHVRLYEHQPLVIVAREGATAAEINTFADEIAQRVFKETGIMLEREVEMFGTG